MCQKSDGQPEVCVTPELPQEWLATLMFMILGVVALTLTCFLLLVSPWKPSIVDAAKWIVFIGSKSQTVRLNTHYCTKHPHFFLSLEAIFPYKSFFP